MKIIIIGIASDSDIRQKMVDIASGRVQVSDDDPKIIVRSADELITLIREGNVNLLTAIRQQAED